MQINIEQVVVPSNICRLSVRMSQKMDRCIHIHSSSLLLLCLAEDNNDGSLLGEFVGLMRTYLLTVEALSRRVSTARSRCNPKTISEIFTFNYLSYYTTILLLAVPQSTLILQARCIDILPFPLLLFFSALYVLSRIELYLIVLQFSPVMLLPYPPDSTLGTDYMVRETFRLKITRSAFRSVAA